MYISLSSFSAWLHSTLKEHAESKTPVLLSNTKENESNKDIIFNQQSDVRVAPSFDNDFDYLKLVHPNDLSQ